MSSSYFRRYCQKYHQTTHYFIKDSVPEWERVFCFKVGRLKWKDLLKLKEYTSDYPKVLQWDDSAGKESFNNAKNRFYAQINNSASQIPPPNPDMYIDEIDWNAKLDPKLFLGLEKALLYQERPSEKVVVPVRLEDIKPTGWDVECTDWNAPPMLTGMIVGDKGGKKTARTAE